MRTGTPSTPPSIGKSPMCPGRSGGAPSPSQRTSGKRCASAGRVDQRGDDIPAPALRTGAAGDLLRADGGSDEPGRRRSILHLCRRHSHGRTPTARLPPGPGSPRRSHILEAVYGDGGDEVLWNIFAFPYPDMCRSSKPVI